MDRINRRGSLKIINFGKSKSKIWIRILLLSIPIFTYAISREEYVSIPKREKLNEYVYTGTEFG